MEQGAYLPDEDLPPPPPQSDDGGQTDGTTASGLGRCRVLFEYEAQREDELTLVPGEELTILQEDEGWWLGAMPDGRQGLFPSNFTERIQ